MSPIMAGVENIRGALGPRWVIPMSGVVVMVFSKDIPGLSVSFMAPPLVKVDNARLTFIWGAQRTLLITDYWLPTTFSRLDRRPGNFFPIGFIHRFCRTVQREHRIDQFVVGIGVDML